MRRRYATLFGVLVMVMGIGSVAVTPVSADNENIVVKVANGKVRAATIPVQGGGVKVMPQISAGTVSAAQKAPGLDGSDVRADNSAAGGVMDSLGVATKTLGCSDRNPDGNVRVNQDCTFRRQAEEIIKYNVTDPNNLVAGQNDSRVGFNHCGFDYSFNGGKTWGDGLPPFWQHINQPQAVHAIVPNTPGTFHTYDAASDPALATDADGRAFFSCVVFDVASNASAVFVTASPAGAGGSFYNNLPEFGSRYVVAEDNSATVAHDKQFIIADSFAGSPNKNNVYITWTVFRFSPKCGPQPNPTGIENYCSSPIFGSMSTDHAVTWSKPEEISGSSVKLCSFGNFFDPTRSPNACDFDQGSDPIVRPDGSLVVVFNNGNTAATDPNAQTLSLLCHPSGDSVAGTAHMNCGAPGFVGSDVIVGEPGCDFGRGPEECIPGAFIRTNDFPRIAVNRQNGHVYSTWQDYTGGEFNLRLAMTTDGVNWTDAAKSVNPDSGKDHYFPAIDIGTQNGEGNDNNNGDHVGVSYYRTDRVPGENKPGVVFAPGQPGVQAENSDYDLAGGRSLNTPYDARKISPTFPPPDGNQLGFNGDYSGLIVIGSTAHPIWSDTRNTAPTTTPSQGVVHDEDIFTTGIALPDGRGDGGGD
jgi:hypothetical protein